MPGRVAVPSPDFLLGCLDPIPGHAGRFAQYLAYLSIDLAAQIVQYDGLFFCRVLEFVDTIANALYGKRSEHRVLNVRPLIDKLLFCFRLPCTGITSRPFLQRYELD